jgi:AcrR family transcriptional regulator
MDVMPRPDVSQVRTDILAAASRLFGAHGFRGTSLQDIASAVGCSKAAVLYHFESKAAILAALAAPAVARLAALDAELADLDGEPAQRAAADGFIDIAVQFRQEMAVMYGDVVALIEQPEFAQLQQMADRLQAALRARRDDLPARTAAIVVIAGVAAACAELAAAPVEDLRAALTAVTARALPPADPTHEDR